MEQQNTPLSERKRTIDINSLTEEQFQQLMKTVINKVNSIIDNAKKESKSVLEPLGMDFLLLVKIGTKEEIKNIAKSAKKIAKPKKAAKAKQKTIKNTKKSKEL